MSFLLGVTLALGLALGTAPGTAATWDIETGSSGEPIGQRFLDSGAAIVATADHMVCVVSRRLEIETSAYVDPDGRAVPFDEILRSPAASLQVVAAAEGTAGFRLQLKYSPRPDSPVLLRLGDAEVDVADRLEPSTDSLWIDGALADRLAAAFVAGEVPVLTAVSHDTGRQVTDRLPVPDLAALADCQALLASATPPTILPSRELRVVFAADPETTPLATLEELRACGMTDPPGELHLARLQSTSGFFAQTDHILVAFDAAGGVNQAYVPGILDADFRDGARRVRISRAADANVPTAENAVSGCLGTALVDLCPYDFAAGQHLIAACPGALSGWMPEDLPGGGTPVRVASDGNIPPGGGGGWGVPPGGGGGGGGGGNPPGGGGGNPPPDGDDDPPPPPAAVPLPAPLALLAGALLGLGLLRRRRHPEN